MERWQRAGLVTAEQAAAIKRMDPGDAVAPLQAIEHWRRLGLLTGTQVEAIRRFELRDSGQAVPKGVTARGAAVGRPAAAPSSARAFARPTLPPPPANIDAHWLGAGLALLALLGLVVGLLGVTTDFFIAPWRLAGADLEDTLHVAASLLGLAGGLRMYRGGQQGKRIVKASLLLNGAATILFNLPRLFDWGVLTALLGWAALYYLTSVSRFAQPRRA